MVNAVASSVPPAPASTPIVLKPCKKDPKANHRHPQRPKPSSRGKGPSFNQEWDTSFDFTRAMSNGLAPALPAGRAVSTGSMSSYGGSHVRPKSAVPMLMGRRRQQQEQQQQQQQQSAQHLPVPRSCQTPQPVFHQQMYGSNNRNETFSRPVFSPQMQSVGPLKDRDDGNNLNRPPMRMPQRNNHSSNHDRSLELRHTIHNIVQHSGHRRKAVVDRAASAPMEETHSVRPSLPKQLPNQQQRRSPPQQQQHERKQWLPSIGRNKQHDQQQQQQQQQQQEQNKASQPLRGAPTAADSAPREETPPMPLPRPPMRGGNGHMVRKLVPGLFWQHKKRMMHSSLRSVGSTATDDGQDRGRPMDHIGGELPVIGDEPHENELADFVLVTNSGHHHLQQQQQGQHGASDVASTDDSTTVTDVESSQFSHGPVSAAQLRMPETQEESLRVLRVEF